MVTNALAIHLRGLLLPCSRDLLGHVPLEENRHLVQDFLPCRRSVRVVPDGLKDCVFQFSVSGGKIAGA